VTVASAGLSNEAATSCRILEPP